MQDLAVVTIPGINPDVTVWVQAGVHGDEEQAVLALLRYLDTARREPPPVTLRALCPANERAFEQRLRCSPDDGLDLNRCFPGDADGSASEQRAAAIWSALSTCQGVIDVHSSSEILIGAPHTIVQAGTSAFEERCVDAGRASGLQILWKSVGTWLGGSLMLTATEAGIPACLVDIGSSRPWEAARPLQRQLTPVLHAYAALAETDSAEPADTRDTGGVEVEIPDPSWITSPATGWIIDIGAPGTRLQPGDIAAVVWSEGGAEHPLLWESASPGLVVTVRARREVAQGDALLSVAALDD